ncbi:hypothetical protein GDO86_010214 [Hymenochirus boettgeri]|uniref:Uncharacterized protein n=1 Tax=Hymenochirus boettgeri TaxID=247094 RepID=A0A8T2JJA3_9PIPI|nr:hypothetical protein GDO86_010214 [Hymenochirus boettgeri]
MMEIYLFYISEAFLKYKWLLPNDHLTHKNYFFFGKRLYWSLTYPTTKQQGFLHQPRNKLLLFMPIKPIPFSEKVDSFLLHSILSCACNMDG